MSEIGPRVSKLDLRDIRRKATDFRKCLNLGDGQIDILWLIEKLGATSELNYDVVENNKLKRNAAIAEPANNLIRMTEHTYMLARTGDPQYQKILAHELGHIVLEHTVQLCFGKPALVHRDSWENSEKQADIFADEFQMPVEGCQSCRSGQDIALKFGVEKDRAILRFQQLKREGLLRIGSS